MEKVDGLDLAAIATQTERDIMEEKRVEIGRVVRGVYSDLVVWEAERKRLHETIKKLDGKIQGGNEKLHKIRSGDWNAVELKPAKPEQAAGEQVQQPKG